MRKVGFKFKRTISSKPQKTRSFVKRRNPVQTLVGRPSSFKETKCRDQVFSPGASVALGLIGTVAYAEPTVAGLGLGTGYSCVNLCSQGPAVSQRIGNKIVIKNIRVRGRFQLYNTQVAADMCFVRALLVYDKQTNGAAPAITEILADVDTTGSYSTIFNSGVKIANRKRFVVLRDQVYRLAVGDIENNEVDWFVKKNMEVTFNNTHSPPVVGDCTTGAIYLVMYYGPTVTTDSPVLSDFTVRIRYDD